MSTIERMTTTRAMSAARTIETRLVTAIVVFGNSVLRTWRNRKAMDALNDMEDSQLYDLGLTRAEVDRAVHRSGLLDDPFVHLPRHSRQRPRIAAVPRRF